MQLAVGVVTIQQKQRVERRGSAIGADEEAAHSGSSHLLAHSLTAVTAELVETRSEDGASLSIEDLLYYCMHCLEHHAER